MYSDVGKIKNIRNQLLSSVVMLMTINLFFLLSPLRLYTIRTVFSKVVDYNFSMNLKVFPAEDSINQDYWCNWWRVNKKTKYLLHCSKQ